MIRRTFLSTSLAVPAALLAGCGTRPFHFIQMADTQLGMIAGGDGSDFSAETAIMEDVVARINGMRPVPAFVAVCGDLTNLPEHPAQVEEYKRLMAIVRDDTPVYNISGNHDFTGNPPPSREGIEAYREMYGRDWYSFVRNGWLFISLNSTLIKTPDAVEDIDQEQKVWLQNELDNVKSGSYQGAAVFMHHPFFDNDIDEEDGYHSISKARRREFLDMFADAGVDAVFSGHRHTTIPVHEYGGVKLINTNAICNSFDDSPGLRIVRCSVEGLEQVFCHREEIPVDLESVFAGV